MLTISQANSIHFFTDNGALPSRENTSPENERFGGHTIFGYCQKFAETDTVTAQCVSDTDVVPTVRVVQSDGTVNFISVTLKPDLSKEPSWADPSEYRYYFEFDIDFSSYSNPFRVYAEKGTYKWFSAWQTVYDVQTEIDNGNMLKLVYTNYNAPSDFESFQVDYRSGITFFMYVESTDRKSVFEIEKSDYKNQTVSQLTQAQLFSGFKLETEPLPKFIVRKIAIAALHYFFTVNDLGYTINGGIDVDESGNSNLEKTSIDFIQKEPLALSTDDRGLPTIEIGEDKMDNQSFIGVTSTISFTLKAGWMTHVVSAKHNSSSAADTFKYKLGYTPGGNEIISEFLTEVNKTEKPQATPVHRTISFDVDTTLYLEIVDSVGAIGNFYVQFFKHTP